MNCREATALLFHFFPPSNAQHSDFAEENASVFTEMSKICLQMFENALSQPGPVVGQNDVRKMVSASRTVC